MQNFIHVHAAALRGLPEVLRGDQALVHGSGPHVALDSAVAVLAPCDMNGARNHVVRLDHPIKGHQQAASDQGLNGAFLWLGSCARYRVPPLHRQQPLLRRVEPGEVVVHLGPLLLCGAALKLVKPKNAIKTARVGFELPLAELFDLKLSGVRDDPSADPVADGALIAAQRVSRQLLIAVVAGNLFGGHGEIMALAIWHLP